mgnify:CR=1 FL=1
MDKQLKILKEKILKSKRFDKPELPYGAIYKFDDFEISETISGDCTVIYRNHSIFRFKSKDLEYMLSEKIEQIFKKLFLSL